MSCSKCNKNSAPCGCSDVPLTTNAQATCEPNAQCPTPIPCSEYVSAACVYLNDGIYDADIPAQTSVEEAIQQLTLMITNPECTNTESCNCPIEGSTLLQTNSVDNTSQTALNNVPSYGMKITNPATSTVLYEAVVNESKAVYVDLQYGDNATAEKYNLVRPYATLAAAYAVAVAGDIIVLNAGTYVIGPFSITQTDVHFYSKPGVIFQNSGFTVATSVNWRFYGYAIFTGSGRIPLNIDGTGGTYDIYFEFDKIDGAMNQAIFIKDPAAVKLNVLVNGNSIRSTSTGNTHLIRVDNSNNINATINIADVISGTQRYIVRFGGFSASVPMVGSIVLNCPVIENTGNNNERACIYLDGVLSTQDNSGYKIVVNSSIIRQTNATMAEIGVDVISSCVWIDGGNNIYIKGDLEGNACLAVCNRGAGATPHYGTIVFDGNMSSNIECISSCVKAGNGNGWHSIVAKNGVIKSKGLGSSIAVVDRPDAWNLIHAGNAGQMYFINCRIINDNDNVSASAVGVNMSPDVALDPEPEKLFLYDTHIYAKAATVCITSSNVSEPVGMINSRSNIALDAMIVDSYTGFTLTASLQLPKY